MNIPKQLVATAILVAATCGGVLWFLRSPADGMDAYPHPFLAEPGYDPAQVVCIAGPIDHPPAPPPGMAPAWQCDDPAFRDAQGRAWLFPMPRDTEAPAIPSHPQLKRKPAIQACRIYRTPEAERQLAAFHARVSP